MSFPVNRDASPSRVNFRERHRGGVHGGARFRHDGGVAHPDASGSQSSPRNPARAQTAKVLTELGEAECYELLAGQDLGRLAIVRDGRPEIFPVNYGLDGRTITIRTAPGVKLSSASFAHVAFEVEQIDPVTREGWVVEVRGFAEDITDAGDQWSLSARNAPVEPWVEGVRDHVVAISHGKASGRRLSTP